MSIKARLEAMLKPNAAGLLPCPNQWCGSLDLRLDEDSAGERTITCQECGCRAYDRKGATAKQDWNRRPLVEALAGAIRCLRHAGQQLGTLEHLKQAEIDETIACVETGILAILDKAKGG